MPAKDGSHLPSSADNSISGLLRYEDDHTIKKLTYLKTNLKGEKNPKIISDEIEHFSI